SAMYATWTLCGVILFSQLVGSGDSQPPVASGLSEFSAGHSSPETIPAIPPELPQSLPPIEATSDPATEKADREELLTEALTPPSGQKLVGQPLALVDALATSGSRSEQYQITRAYWRLAESQAHYHYALQFRAQLDQLRTQFAGAAVWPMIDTSATALVHEREADAVAAQHALAAALRLPAGNVLPLPADRPHLSSYSTYFETLVAQGRAPLSARVAHDTLPLRREALQHRVAAVRAADSALNALLAAPAHGAQMSDAILSALRECLQNRQAFITAVASYNTNIADYAFSVAGPEVTSPQLAGMLIKATDAASTDAGVVPAGWHAPLAPGGTAPPTLAPGYRQAPGGEARPLSEPPAASILAEPAGRYAAPSQPSTAGASELRPVEPRQEPTLAPPPPGDLPSPGSAQEPTLAPPRDTPQTREEGLPPIPPSPQGQIAPEPSATPGSNAAWEPIPAPAPTAAIPRSALRPLDQPAATEEPGLAIAATASDAPESSEFAMYPGLAQATTAERLKELSAVLHWDRSTTTARTEPVSLTDCLNAARPERRSAALQTYWTACQRCAEHQVLIDELGWLATLDSQLADPLQRTRIQPILEATRAAVLASEAAEIEAIGSLAQDLGRASLAAWPRPSTTPRTDYVAMDDDSAMVRSLAAALAAQADAVIEADRYRARTTAALSAGGASIDDVLRATAMQTQLTRSLVRTLGDYNRLIADQACRRAPTASSDELLKVLIAPGP
ncbi:MAG: hypothetical protein ACOY3P_05945, partial [Planctomycetota bacterium]